MSAEEIHALNVKGIKMPGFKKRSKLAVICTSLYLIALVASVIVMFATSADTAMSGVFLVMVSMPWTLLLSWLSTLFTIDSMVFSALFLVAGGLVNSVILYAMLSFVTGGYKQ